LGRGGVKPRTNLESLLDGVLGTGVEHLGLDSGGLRAVMKRKMDTRVSIINTGSRERRDGNHERPEEEDDLGALAIGTSVVLEVEDGITVRQNHISTSSKLAERVFAPREKRTGSRQRGGWPRRRHSQSLQHNDVSRCAE
jgi:hypothetical protein